MKPGSAVLTFCRKLYQSQVKTQQTFTCSNSAVETLERGVKYVMTLFWCLYCWLWTYFIPFSSVSTVEFENVNV